jgi:hypothetical protein
MAWKIRRVAHCEECGFEWLPKKKEPLRCASNKCQSRMWNRNGHDESLCDVRPKSKRAARLRRKKG